MEEKTNPEESKLDKYTEEKVKKGIETLLNEKELKIKWRKELEDNPAVVNYFKNFNGNALEDFIKSYLPQKYSYYVIKTRPPLSFFCPGREKRQYHWSIRSP